MIKAIETRYKGYRFRSRLEARWAVFFDAIQWHWDYEIEGYDLGDLGWYLPDFLITQYESKWWMEIKPSTFSDTEIKKCAALAEMTGIPVFMCDGVPDGREYPTTAFFPNGRFYWRIPPGHPSIDAARSARFEHGEKPK